MPKTLQVRNRARGLGLVLHACRPAPAEPSTARQWREGPVLHKCPRSFLCVAFLEFAVIFALSIPGALFLGPRAPIPSPASHEAGQPGAIMNEA